MSEDGRGKVSATHPQDTYIDNEITQTHRLKSVLSANAVVLHGRTSPRQAASLCCLVFQPIRAIHNRYMRVDCCRLL